MLEQSNSFDESLPSPQTRVVRDRLHVVSSEIRLLPRIRQIWLYRPLLMSLIRKELSVKYKNSALGFAWSMLNPALTLVVYYVVFQLVFKSGTPQFAIFLLCGLVVWNFFTAALSGATTAVVGNAGIVKKVAFPREVLPLAAVGSSLVFFFLQLIVLAIALVIARDAPALSYLPLVLVALFAVVLFTSSLAIFLSALNVYYRDTQHLLEIVLMAWFWATPIVYPYRLIADPLTRHHLIWLFFLNPMTAIVITFQRALYAKVDPVNAAGTVVHVLSPNSPTWYLGELAIVIGVSTVLFALALHVFGRMEGNFAEEL